MGHYDRYRDASARAGEGKRLAVVAARGGDYPLYLRPLAFEPVEIDNAAAYLESADWSV